MSLKQALKREHSAGVKHEAVETAAAALDPGVGNVQIPYAANHAHLIGHSKGTAAAHHPEVKVPILP